MPINIGGSDISSATIDGTEVQEITIDGNIAYTAKPEVLTINFGGTFDVYELGTWNKLNDVSPANYTSGWDMNNEGTYLACGASGQTDVYKINGWTVEKSLTYQTDLQDIKFSADNKYLVYCDNLWDATYTDFTVVNTSDWSTAKNLTGGDSPREIAAGTNYIAGASDVETYVWTLGGWSQKLFIDHSSSGETSRGMAFDPDENNFVWTHSQNPTRVYDTSNWSKTTEIEQAEQPRFSPSGDQLLFVKSSDVQVWDTSSTDPTNWSKTQFLNDGDVTYDACWADGGNYLIFTSRDNQTVYVYETSGWTLETSISVPNSPQSVQATL